MTRPSIPFIDLPLKDKIKYLRDLNLSVPVISYIIAYDEETIRTILIKQGMWGKHHPNSKPDIYYIKKLMQGYTVKEIANELNCTKATIYRLLERRGISLDTYRNNPL